MYTTFRNLRKEIGGGIVGTLAGAIVVVVPWVIFALAVMLAVGNVHQWWRFVPTMGFGTALEITAPIVAGLALKNYALGKLAKRARDRRLFGFNPYI